MDLSDFPLRRNTDDSTAASKSFISTDNSKDYTFI